MLESRQSRRRGAFALTVLVGVVAATAATVAIAAGTLGDWPMGGQNINNTRAQDQSTIGVGNVGRLKVKWTATLGGDVSSTPAISGGAVYVTDWGEFEPSKIFSLGGSLTKLDAKTGGVLWTRRIDSYAGEPAGAVSRTSPVVADGVVYVGDQNGGHMLAIDAATGNLIWNTAIANPGPFTIITQSPIIHDGVLYFGAASLEELFVAFGAPCCSFRGSVQALDAKTGAVKWTTYMTPATPAAPDGYSGASVWGSTPALDPKSGTLYVTTGNNYSVPPDVEAGAPDDPANFVDSFVALDIKTGAVKWATGVDPGSDAWNVACIFGGSACPENPGPDYDFGSGPNLLTAKVGGKTRLAVGAGQKSGMYWMLDATTGQVLWATEVGPGSTLGGIQWGTATADGRVLVAHNNLNMTPHEIPTPDGPQTINYGSYAALDVTTGRKLWQIPDPSGSILDIGPVTVSNGVMYVGSMSGWMYAFKASSGEKLWEFKGQGSSNAGPAISKDGVVYWGNGYEHFGFGAPSRTFYAFSIDGT